MDDETASRPTNTADDERDLHEIVRAAEERARRACEQERTATLNALATTVAHRVRNPLAGISAVVQLVSSSLAADDARREALGHVLEQVARLGALCGDLLAFAEHPTPRAEEVDLRACVRAAALAASAGWPAGVVDVSGAGAARADPLLVQQIISQLFMNAFEAGARHIMVELADGTVSLDDDGPGLAASARHHLFEPFFTTKLSGTGLGLPIAQQLLASMGGAIDATASHALGGARFVVHLPAAAPA